MQHVVSLSTDILFEVLQKLACAGDFQACLAQENIQALSYVPILLSSIPDFELPRTVASGLCPKVESTWAPSTYLEKGQAQNLVVKVGVRVTQHLLWQLWPLTEDLLITQFPWLGGNLDPRCWTFYFQGCQTIQQTSIPHLQGTEISNWWMCHGYLSFPHWYILHLRILKSTRRSGCCYIQTEVQTFTLSYHAVLGCLRTSSDKHISLISPFASCCERVQIFQLLLIRPGGKGRAHRDQGFRDYVFNSRQHWLDCLDCDWLWVDSGCVSAVKVESTCVYLMNLASGQGRGRLKAGCSIRQNIVYSVL